MTERSNRWQLAHTVRIAIRINTQSFTFVIMMKSLLSAKNSMQNDKSKGTARIILRDSKTGRNVLY